MPQRRGVRGNHPVIADNHDGTVSIAYDPKEEGLHEMSIKFNGEHIQGSPLKIYVDSITSGYMTAYGPGLVKGICGEPCNFTIATKDAGSGGLSLNVEGPSKSEISCHDNKDGSIAVTYLPTAPGEYKVSCKYMEKQIRGSPFSVKVTGEGRKRNQISVPGNSEVTLPSKMAEKDIKVLNASIRAPSGLEEPCFLKRTADGSLGISFTPREVGEHAVSVKKMGNHIFKSPFTIRVGELEVGDFSKVSVSGPALTEGKTQVDNEFTVDTRNAGYGGLSVSIEGPSKADLSASTRDDGTVAVKYKPSDPGFYILNLKFADHHIYGSPFTAKVTGEGTNQQTTRTKREIRAVTMSEVGEACKLTFKMPGVSAFELTAIITSPGGVSEDAEITEDSEGFYAVNFAPKELGVHIISVKVRDIHIPGSPFQYTVGPLRDYGSHRVHAGGPGLEKGEVKTANEFNIWTREAGAGSLSISVEGPSKADIKVLERPDGSCYAGYTVDEPGDYRVGIKFNDLHTPDSPYKVYVSPQLGDAKKVEIGQFPDSLVTTNKPISFIISRNGAKGQLECKVGIPSGAVDDCFVAPMDEGVYAVRYLPKENGIHFFHVRLNGVHIPGSPFRLKIGKDEADPAAVNATGPGIKEIVSGQKTDFIIDTSAAGSGTLAVAIDGPSKVSMDCTEADNGYKVRYTPLAPGDYYVSVKYNGYHIAGSPFRVRCTGHAITEETTITETSSVIVETSPIQGKGNAVDRVVLPKFHSDASKVKTRGMGLKKAYMHKQNQFNVLADEAGQNLLYCAIIGPKEPGAEVMAKHQGKNMFLVNYVVHERGDHILVVKWGDDHIPGSPFKVEVP